MSTQVDPSLELLQQYRANHVRSTEPYNPSMGEYALAAPIMVYSMWTVLGALQNWIEVASTEAMLAESAMLATASDLSAKASENLSNILEADNDTIQEIADNDGSSNDMQSAQSQFSTDQTAYGVAVTDYQGSLQQWTQSLQTLTSSISSLVGMATQLEQTAWVPQAT